MSIGFMAKWRCAFKVQSPAPAGPSARPQQQQQQHPFSPVRTRDTYTETGRVSILHSIPEVVESWHSHSLKTYMSSTGTQLKNQSDSLKPDELQTDKSYGIYSELSGMVSGKQVDGTALSNNGLRFSLLVENLDAIEDILDSSDLIRLENDILRQIEQLGALHYFCACVSSTYMTPISLDLPSSIPDAKRHTASSSLNENSCNQPRDDHHYIVVESGRKKDRELRRERATQKAANASTPSLSSKVIRKDRNGNILLAGGLTTTNSKSRSRRIAVARNESKMSLGVKDIARLEKIRLELEEETGNTASLLSWAQAVGTDRKALQERLHFGWSCKDKLLRSTRPFVVYIARSYRGMGIAFDDLIQAGYIGVLQGAERFDPGRGYKFSTYVQYWIRKSISGVIARHSRGIYLPATMENAIKQLQKAKSILSSSKQRCMQEDEALAELTGFSLTKVRLARKCARGIGSIDQKVGGGFNAKVTEVTVDTSIRTPEESVMKQHLRRDIERLLDGLHPRERRVVLLRYGFEGGRQMSLEETGRLLQVSKEWVRRMEMAALAKLRREEVQGELKHYVHIQFT